VAGGIVGGLLGLILLAGLAWYMVTKRGVGARLFGRLNDDHEMTI